MESTPAPPQVTVVVLSYNRPELLVKALNSIARQTYPNCDILVVDNLSPASARIKEIVEPFDGVRLIPNSANNGFTGGMNRGLADAKGEYIYLTEDDVELAPDCLANLINYLESHSEVALAGPVMWNLGTHTVRCAGGEFRLESGYRMRVIGEGEKSPPAQLPFHTGYLPGAMIAAKTAELRALGGFHPDFFMYGEDVELCARVLERGRAIAIVPAARVYHHEPPDGAISPLLSFHKQKNLGALYLLHAPLAVLPLFFLRHVIIAGARCLVQSPRQMPWFLKSWSWVVAASPRLLAQRMKHAA